ncbi:MAG: hypothetical protein IMF05_09800, partial [Proteobacteria bacterium]|nr:hypothetical protein [Pseudomonadota bacterium]
QRPDTAELERLAEAVLREHPLPDDRQDRSYEQRMALKARSIADYDRKHGAAGVVEELALFTTLYGPDAVEEVEGNDEARIEALNRRLAAEIRACKWDEASPTLIALLMQQVRARLIRTNPRYLKTTLGE